jgi:hypothetical protein
MCHIGISRTCPTHEMFEIGQCAPRITRTISTAPKDGVVNCEARVRRGELTIKVYSCENNAMEGGNSGEEQGTCQASFPEPF